MFTLLHFEGGPGAAGRTGAASAVVQHPQVIAALKLLQERFRDDQQDAPRAYASFLGIPGDEDEKARLRQEAVATVRAFLRSFHGDP